MPKCFKPGHIDPHDQTTVEGVGWLVKGKGGVPWWYQCGWGSGVFWVGKVMCVIFFGCLFGGVVCFGSTFLMQKCHPKTHSMRVLK